MTNLPDQRPLPTELAAAMEITPATDDAIEIVRSYFKNEPGLISDPRFVDWLRREKARISDWSERHPIEQRRRT